jgi:hypothetical protein
MILQRKQKKNRGIQSSYEKDILITNLYCESKRKMKHQCVLHLLLNVATWWNWIGPHKTILVSHMPLLLSERCSSLCGYIVLVSQNHFTFFAMLMNPIFDVV